MENPSGLREESGRGTWDWGWGVVRWAVAPVEWIEGWPSLVWYIKVVLKNYGQTSRQGWVVEGQASHRWKWSGEGTCWRGATVSTVGERAWRSRMGIGFAIFSKSWEQGTSSTSSSLSTASFCLLREAMMSTSSLLSSLPFFPFFLSPITKCLSKPQSINTVEYSTRQNLNICIN